MSAEKPALPRLHLIRHGETEWSLSSLCAGSSGIPLTAHGEYEARDLVPWLRGHAFTRVLCSPRQRARRTCELARLGAQAETTPALAEWELRRVRGAALG